VSHCQYEGRYLLGTSIARPLIAKEQMRLAQRIKAQYVAHGATGKGNDQVRFELTYQALSPQMGILPIWRDPEFIATFREGRKSMLQYAEQHGLEVKASTKMPWSSDDNRLHISYEAGLLEDPWLSAPQEIFERMVHPFDAPDKPIQFIIHWNQGIPVAVSSTKTTVASIQGLSVPTYEPYEVIVEGFPAVFDWIDQQAAAHGVGSLGMVESRYVGMKSRGEYHAPGHTVLLKAHYDMESICLTGSMIAEKEKRMSDFATMVYNGYWYDPACQALKRFFLGTQSSVTGETRVSLYKGNVILEGRRSPCALYDAHVATMDGDGSAYNQQDASGFIRLHGLPLRMVRQSQDTVIDW
jgi:argininosuccinate synthase